MNRQQCNLLFPQTCRYHGTETAKLTTAEGKEIIYLKRRFLPQGNSLALIQEHAVEQEDRLDNITAKYLGDPEQFWRICDANNAMNPADMTKEIGRRLRITMPEGVPGGANAPA